MNPEQITKISADQVSNQILNIGIQLGQANQKADTAIIVAVVSGLFAIVAAFVAGYFRWKISEMAQVHEKKLNEINQSHEKRLSEMDKEHEKQWAFVNRKVILIDRAIEVCWKIIFNKLAIADLKWTAAHENIFLLQKDAWIIESEMAVYASQELVDAFAEYKNYISNISPETIRANWNEIIDKGRNCLMLCRKHLGKDVSEKYEEFAKNLITSPPLEEEVKAITVNVNSLGALTATTSTLTPKIITENNSTKG